jgi:hypothetical protein
VVAIISWTAVGRAAIFRFRRPPTRFSAAVAEGRGTVTGRRLTVSSRGQRVASRLLQGVIAVALVVGLLTRNLSVVVNAALTLALTFVPAVLRRDYRIELDAGVTLWVTLALCLHTLGMLGIYAGVWWYDHVTHTLSATIVAAAGYVVARAVDETSDDVYLPPRFMFVFVLLFTLGLGVIWEVLEFFARLGADLLGLDPVLVQYGLEDTLLDLLFDTLGAVLVATFGTGTVAHVVASVADRLAERDAAGVDHARAGVAGLERVVRSGPTNARVAWLLTGALAVAVVGGLLAGAVLPSLLVAVVVALAVVPAVATRDPAAMLPWPLLTAASLPVFGGVVARPWLASGPITYFAVATIALVVAVELHLFTPVRMTPGFAVGFVVVTTVGVAGVWAVGRWLVDLTFGTELLLVAGRTDAEVETRLMWEFVASAAAGLVAGATFEWGFRRR